MPKFVYVVTAYDTERGVHIVGIFDDDAEAEDAACVVPEPWSAMYEEYVVGKVHLPPRIESA
jgi:hypothetical protein